MAASTQNIGTSTPGNFSQGVYERTFRGKNCAYCALSILQLVNTKLLLGSALTCDKSYDEMSYSLAGVSAGFSLINFCTYLSLKEKSCNLLFVSFESVVLISTIALATLVKRCAPSFPIGVQEVLVFAGISTFLQIVNLSFNGISSSLPRNSEGSQENLL